MDVLGHEQHRALGARALDQVHDFLDDPVLDVAGGERRHPRAPAAQQLADRSPPGIRRPPAQTKSRSDHTERAGALEGMCLAAVHGNSTRTRVVDDALHQAGLANAGFPLDHQHRRPALAEIAHGSRSQAKLGLPTHQSPRRRHIQRLSHASTRVQLSKSGEHSAAARSFWVVCGGRI